MAGRDSILSQANANWRFRRAVGVTIVVCFLTYRCLCTTSSFGAFLVAISLAQGIYFTF